LCLYLDRSHALRPGTDVLHYAPEPSTTQFLRQRVGPGYRSIDLTSPLADALMDATSLQYPDASFDLVLCSHVLEHVPDDRAAMREMHRVLRPGGVALLQHPVVPGQCTFEDPTVTDPEERLRLFSQEDHVRVYGPDIGDRLREAGFAVETIVPEELGSADDLDRYGLREPLSPAVRASDIHVCRV
jgi:SAM-dependent methyltransferase